MVLVGVLGLCSLMLARCQLRAWLPTDLCDRHVGDALRGILANKFLNGHSRRSTRSWRSCQTCWLNADYKGIDIGPIPRGTPVNLHHEPGPDRKLDKVVPAALVGLIRATVQIKRQHLTGEEAYKVLAEQAGPSRSSRRASARTSCSIAGIGLARTSEDPKTTARNGRKRTTMKEALIAFLKTL